MEWNVFLFLTSLLSVCLSIWLCRVFEPVFVEKKDL